MKTFIVNLLDCVDAVLTRVWTFLRVIDDNGDLSLTNIALMICLWKLWSVKEPSLTELGAFFVAIASYQAKRAIHSKEDVALEAISAAKEAGK